MSKNFGPEISNVLSTGVQVHTDKSLIFTFDGYIKETSGMVDFKPGASFIYDYSFEEMLERTKGRAVGIETGIIKSKGKLSGAFNYTYSRSKREWSAATGTIWIPTSADRPHNLNLSMKYFFNQKVSFGLNWVYISGAPATIYTHSTGDEEWYESQNNIRYFPYHRLDLSMRKIFYFKKNSMFLDLDINNVYNRKNTFYFKEMFDPVNHSRYFKNISLFPIMPSLSLTIKF
jgi:outer membrane receptor for ferrienterochelin and colicin